MLVERGDCVRFSLETVARNWIGGDVRWEHLIATVRSSRVSRAL